MTLYTLLRHMADSYGLAALLALYLMLCLWHLRPGARRFVADAKHSIFRDDDND
ncbi:cbb3-type cytochrome c oxidase subunit 3 [Porphyrobacter sp. AAP82]|uniref:cbb3-type cytochrome c oxidase subunit 3 n=1 Tax=Porphyrobacter sp. AAP82 TaxID=1248917 RepID=UPI0002DB8D9B|nr:cbb3-type cytochrome c oxidase subunit 3 [Porphyrobacter sp. AAP82]